MDLCCESAAASAAAAAGSGGDGFVTAKIKEKSKFLQDFNLPLPLTSSFAAVPRPGSVYSCCLPLP